MTPKPPHVSKRIKDIQLPDSMFPSNKDPVIPIRYFEVVKHYKWGCPKCEMTTLFWNVLWLHYKEDHGTPPWEYQTPAENYVLKEFKW